MAGKDSAIIDFGPAPVASAEFVITDANITSSATVVEPFVVITATGDNNAEAHRHAAASWRLSAESRAGEFTLYVDCLIDLCFGTFEIQYAYA